MIMEPVEISNQIQVIPGGMLLIPHCEPPSAMSTLRFAAYYASGNCGTGHRRLEDALAAIPGSYVVYGVNFGPPNFRQRWFRLPPAIVGCPCPSIVDYYRILRDLPEVIVEEEPGPCGPEVAEWCDEQIDFNVPSAPDTYFEDNIYPDSVGVLPPIPPYALD